MNYTAIRSGDLAHVLFRRQHTILRGQVLYRLGSDGLLSPENPHFVFGLLLPVHWTRSPFSPPRVSGEASEAVYNQVSKHIVMFPPHIHTLYTLLTKSKRFCRAFPVLGAVPSMVYTLPHNDPEGQAPLFLPFYR